MQLREALEHTPTGTLRRVAGLHRLVYDDSTTRAELIQRVAERLLEPVYLDAQLRGLDDDQRLVLLSARASAGGLRGALVDREHPGAAEALAERGLLYRVFASAGPLRGEVLVVPAEVLELLPARPPPEAPPAGEPPPAERRASDPAFSLFALSSVLTRGGGRLEREVRPWSHEPGGWDWDARWAFLRHLGQAAGLLVHPAAGGLANGPSLTRLLDRPAELAERLWHTYLADRGWSELARAGVDAGDAGGLERVGGLGGVPHGEELAEAVPLRRALVDAVLQLPENAWISVDAFVAWVERSRPTLVREQLNARGVVMLESMAWPDLEGRVLHYVLLGPLYWLGVVAASADGRQVARRGRGTSTSATPTSAEAAPATSAEARPRTSQGAAPATTSREACRWEAPAELLAPARALLGTLLEAERYLVLLERGRISRYQLDQAHVAAALSGGGSIGECRQLLIRLTQAELPEDVAERLATWERRFGALAVRPTVLIEARSAGELDEAISDERVRPFVRARLGPTVAEVPAADALELAARLRQAGHLPRVDAALRLTAEPRRAYAGLVDEQVLEFLLVGLLAFQRARPEGLGELEGSLTLLDRLERQFPRERLVELRAVAARLAGELVGPSPPLARRRRQPPNRARRPRV